MLWLADRHSDQELYTAAKHCAKIHLAQLHQTEEFLNLPLCLLLDIVKGICSNRPAALGTWNLCTLDSLGATRHFEIENPVFKIIEITAELFLKCSFCTDGVPTSQNPTTAIESWINHNKVEREEFSCILQENLKVFFFFFLHFVFAHSSSLM